ncbi:MAG: hypothetical protein LBP59_08370 [Planctomycetaceae bacterium]|nr:hypothetical protein [Planctomycetaceae bacterium]
MFCLFCCQLTAAVAIAQTTNAQTQRNPNLPSTLSSTPPPTITSAPDVTFPVIDSFNRNGSANVRNSSARNGSANRGVNLNNSVVKNLVNWKVLHIENGNGYAKIIEHKIIQKNQIQPYEQIKFNLPDKSSISLGCVIGYPSLIDELDPSVSIRSNDKGVTLAAQIVLPNSIHPQTKKPVTFIVAGSNYSGSGDWENLNFHDKNGRPDLWKRVDKILIPLRAELNPLDLREKYVRQLILFIEHIPNQPPQKVVNIGSLDVVGVLPVREELQLKFESQPNNNQPNNQSNNFGALFDPVNFNGFKLTAGSQCEFVTTHVANDGWLDKVWGQNPDKLVASPLTPQPYQIDPQQLRATNPATILPLIQTESPNNSRALIAKNNPSAAQNFTLLQQNNYAAANLENQNFRPATTNIQISDKILLVNNTPIGVRAIEYQGEPLSFLRKLEFNTVWIKERPSPSLLREAQEAGVWLICKPPSPNEIENAKIQAAAAADAAANVGAVNVGAEKIIDANISVTSSLYDNVLVWNMGDDCTQPRHQEDTNRATLLQSADRLRRRPLICTARSGVWEYSRIVDILLMESKPLLSSLDFNELFIWQNSYPMLARPDTPFWTTVQTDVDPKLANQWIMFGGNTNEICAITHEQIKMQVHQALACGIHGIIFTSNTPLTNNDPATEYRRLSLELINWELQLVEDWFAGGHDQPTLVNSTGRRQMSAAVIQAGRTRLLAPIWRERNSQLSVSGAFEGSVRFIIPGIPDTYGAYLLVPNRMFPLSTRRVAGGTEVLLEEASLNSFVYFGEVDAFYARVGERAKVIGERCAYLACRLAELQLASTRQVMEMLKQAKESNSIPIHPRDKLPLIALQEQESHFRMTLHAIDVAKSFINQSPPAYGMAYLQAERATRGLRVVSRDLLREATRHDLNACMTPVSVSFATLPYYLAAFQRTAGATLGQNRLAAGDMENVISWQRNGWSSQRHKVEGIIEQLSISEQAARSGKNGLKIVAKVDGGESKPKQIETAPVWVITPPVNVRMGEMICVSGWIRVPAPLESGVDGLTIFDSLGGEALALRFKETGGQWREFAFYRYVPEDANYYVFFALNALGEVNIDDVRIAPVIFDQPKPIIPPIKNTPTLPSLPRIPIDRLNPLQYLPNLQNLGGNQ